VPSTLTLSPPIELQPVQLAVPSESTISDSRYCDKNNCSSQNKNPQNVHENVKQDLPHSARPIYHANVLNIRPKNHFCNYPLMQ
jgi:hypothetical protein